MWFLSMLTCKTALNEGMQMRLVALLLLAITTVVNPVSAWARDYEYEGGEIAVYVRPGEPTMVTFPGKVLGGYLAPSGQVTVERSGESLVVYSQPGLVDQGEAVLVQIEDNRSYALRVYQSNSMFPRDDLITVRDLRQPEFELPEDQVNAETKPENAPSTSVQGLMREMVLVAEFGKMKGIPGYRRSNRYSGETVVHDGAVEAKIDEIFMGTNLWGYVLSVENLLDTNQRINPAVFRIDGTRAISAERWELAPRPVTSEQKIANQHAAKVYIITRSKRR